MRCAPPSVRPTPSAPRRSRTLPQPMNLAGVFLICSALLSYAAPAQSACMTYGGRISLHGTLTRQVFPGPPGYESIARGEQRGNLPMFLRHLQPPGCVVGNPTDPDGSRLTSVGSASRRQDYRHTGGPSRKGAVRFLPTLDRQANRLVRELICRRDGPPPYARPFERCANRGAATDNFLARALRRSVQRRKTCRPSGPSGSGRTLADSAGSSGP